MTREPQERTGIDRRQILKTGLLGAAAGGIVACEPCGGLAGPAVHTQQRVQWRLASSFPNSLDTIYGAAEVLAANVDAMSGGNFQIRVYQAGELVPGLQVLESVQRGACEVGQTAGYYYRGKNEALAFDTCVPFGLTERQQTAWLEEGGGRELVDEVYAGFGMRSFPSGNTGVQMGGWFKREVNSMADMKGLLMRIPGLGGVVMDALGVSVQVLAGGDIYPALERGTIDATEWVGPYDDEKLGFHRIAQNYYYPGWWEPGPSLSFLVGDDAWDRLPASYQAIFRAAASVAATTMMARYDAKNPPALKRLLAAGVQLRPFSSDIMLAAREASRDIMAGMSSADAQYRKIHEHWDAFRQGAFDWFGAAERAYVDFAMDRPS